MAYVLLNAMLVYTNTNIELVTNIGASRILGCKMVLKHLERSDTAISDDEL